MQRNTHFNFDKQFKFHRTLSKSYFHLQQSKASVGPPPSATPPTKKRRLLEEAEVTNNNTRGHALTSGPGLHAASNGLMPRPASAKSLRASGASSDLDNYSDIRPDILEMIKEEQKVRSCHNSQVFSIPSFSKTKYIWYSSISQKPNIHLVFGQF